MENIWICFAKTEADGRHLSILCGEIILSTDLLKIIYSVNQTQVHFRADWQNLGYTVRIYDLNTDSTIQNILILKKTFL